VNQFVGKPLTEVIAQIRAMAGDGVRIIGPNPTMLTDDYRPNRINVYQDANGIITRIDNG
jgi:hypothetical protein